MAQTVVRLGMPPATPGFQTVSRSGGSRPEELPTVTVAAALLEGSATLVATTWKVPVVPGAV